MLCNDIHGAAGVGTCPFRDLTIFIKIGLGCHREFENSLSIAFHIDSCMEKNYDEIVIKARKQQ